VLGAVLSMGKTLGDYNQRVLTLEADKITTASQIGALSQKIDDMSHQIQRLQDRLEDKGDISYPQARKHSVQFPVDSRDVSGSGAPHY
jgi:septal ring factor EnvC (AmiA/AmiB activator)